ncbi:MAG: hypothetical protein NWT08_03290 [Akkermansiaceae bacterium]|jgi:hypothetical protein|nr:hypothetical protein [Akkermansiaceae bacterium]MDP4647817.1 hypothetical protein [Akkermansiaceae bacterium]MDP4779062.1 hypothetical protein [Akkermansiaceae bacterium]MDP4845919.1 hypothetical protein [Akkermansiaceae bacterium]MDP4897758.1 hypothetical protein [Akkermansiaceae bacterium]
MKASILWIALAATSFAEPLVVVAPTTAQELSEKQQSGSLSSLSQTVISEAPVPRASSQSIVAQSEILHDGVHWTLVPKGAVLFVPERKSLHVGARPVGTLLQWRDFLAKNPAWISTHETSFAQACGDSPLPEATVEHWKKQDCVIVAVHQGGPISVAR